MKDVDKPISEQDRSLVLSVCIGVGVVATSFVFVLFLFATWSLLISLFFGLATLIIVPFVYLWLGRITAVQIDQTREQTYQGTREPWTKSEVIQLSTVSPLTTGPVHFVLFLTQFFDEQWSEENLQKSSSSEKVVENPTS